MARLEDAEIVQRLCVHRAYGLASRDPVVGNFRMKLYHRGNLGSTRAGSYGDVSYEYKRKLGEKFPYTRVRYKIAERTEIGDAVVLAVDFSVKFRLYQRVLDKRKKAIVEKPFGVFKDEYRWKERKTTRVYLIKRGGKWTLKTGRSPIAQSANVMRVLE